MIEDISDLISDCSFTEGNRDGNSGDVGVNESNAWPKTWFFLRLIGGEVVFTNLTSPLRVHDKSGVIQLFSHEGWMNMSLSMGTLLYGQTMLSLGNIVTSLGQMRGEDETLWMIRLPASHG